MSNDLSRWQNIFLYIIGTCDELRSDGLLDGGPQLTADGLARVKEIKDSGFSVSEEEIAVVLHTLKQRNLAKATAPPKPPPQSLTES